jgi:hypothetical protein
VRQLLFDPISSDRQQFDRVDWSLLRDSPVHQVDSVELLDLTLAELRRLGYLVVEFDADGLAPEALHDAFASAFEFPEWYGGNLDALNDMLRDVALFERGADPSATGTVLAIRGFGPFSEEHREVAQAILDLWALQARTGLVVGHPMILLVAVPDSSWFAPVGASPVLHFRRRPAVE